MATFNPRMLTLARESRGRTQRTLEERSGVSQGYISKIERHIRPAFGAEQVARVLGPFLSNS